MNPGDGASRNDENLNMIRDPRLVSLYEKKFEDVRRHERTDNVWAAERGMNVLFTPAKNASSADRKTLRMDRCGK